MHALAATSRYGGVCLPATMAGTLSSLDTWEGTCTTATRKMHDRPNWLAPAQAAPPNAEKSGAPISQSACHIDGFGVAFGCLNFGHFLRQHTTVFFFLPSSTSSASPATVLPATTQSALHHTLPRGLLPTPIAVRQGPEINSAVATPNTTEPLSHPLE